LEEVAKFQLKASAAPIYVRVVPDIKTVVKVASAD